MSRSRSSSPRCGVEDTECNICHLPCETLLHIFSYLPAKDIASCAETCRFWSEIINQCDILWKIQCLNLKFCNQSITADRQQGKSWKEIFQKNYGSNGVKSLWKKGLFSNLKSYQDLPAQPFCKLDADSWGQILQWELDRS